MMKRVLTGSAVALAAVLSGCGGGEGATTKGAMSNEVKITSPTLKVGQSIDIAAYATMRGAAPEMMKWTAAPLSANGAGTALSFADDSCAAATFSPPLFGNDQGVGECKTVLTVPMSAKSGTWRITNTAAGAAGTISDSIDVDVTAMSASGFRLTEMPTPVTAFVGRATSLSMPFMVNPGAMVSNTQYQWTAAPSNPAVVPIMGANNSTATITPVTPGNYLFNVTVSADVNGVREVATGLMTVSVSSANVQISAGVSQVIGSGNIVTLQGSILNQDPLLSYTTSWRQLPGAAGGPVAVTLNNANSLTPDFISPAAAGTYGFEFKVVKTLADGSQVVTTSQTSVLVTVVAPSAFSVTAGDASFAKVGDVVKLSGGAIGVIPSAGVSVTYGWTQIGTTPAVVTLSNASTANATFIAATPGTYTFKFSVTTTSSSGSITVSSDTSVQVSAVVAPISNFAITASAGDALTIGTGQVATLLGTKTTQGADAGVLYTYKWTQIGTTPAAVTISNAGAETATFIPAVAGVYDLQFTVTATLPNGESSVVSATTQVVAGGLGMAFAVSAGDAQAGPAYTPFVMQGAISTNGSNLGASYTYQWTQVGATPTAVLVSNANALAASFAPTVPGSYTFMLVVTRLLDGVTSTQTAQVQILVI